MRVDAVDRKGAQDFGVDANTSEIHKRWDVPNSAPRATEGYWIWIGYRHDFSFSLFEFASVEAADSGINSPLNWLNYIT
jgi:hypothetical protein